MDIVHVFTPINILFGEGGELGSLNEDKVDVFTPVNIFFREGGKFSCDDDHDVFNDDDDDDDDDDDVEQRPGWVELVLSVMFFPVKKTKTSPCGLRFDA